MSRSGHRILHLQPMTLDLFGHEDRDFGTTASYFLPNLARAQVEAGHNVAIHLLTSSRPSSLSLDGIEVTFHRCLQPPSFVGPHRRFGRQLSLRMLNEVSRRQVDVVHFHGVRNCQLMFAAVAVRAARVRLPLVAHDQGSRKVSFVEERAFRHGLSRTAAIIAGNTESAKLFQSEGVPGHAVHTIPNGYDPDIFFPGLARGRREPDSLRILLVSRFTSEKDPLTAARAIAEFAGSGHALDLTLVGTGPLRAEAQRLLSEVDELAIHDRLPQPELAELYRQADVLLLSSLGEGSNQTVVEAMACGLPVIATDVPGIRDVVDTAGILVPARDPGAAAAALARVVEEPMLLASLRDRGLDRVRSLTWASIVKEIDRVYDDVVELHRAWA